jgi:hypothetical protein
LNPPGDFDLSRDWQNEIDYVWNVNNHLTINNTFFKRRNRDQYSDAETLTYVPATDQVTRSILYFQHNRRPIQDVTDLVGDYTFLHMRHHFLVRYDYSDQYNSQTERAMLPIPATRSVCRYPPCPFPHSSREPLWILRRIQYLPITRVDYSDNRFHRVTLQTDQPGKVAGVNLAITDQLRPADAQRRLRQRDFVSRGVESHFFNNSTNNYRFGPQSYRNTPVAAWSRSVFQLQQHVHPVNSLQNDGTPLNPVLSKSWEWKPVARTE